MSAPLELNSRQLRDLANALRDFTNATRAHQVYIYSYGTQSVRLGDADAVIEITWDEEAREYKLDDRIGS